MTPRTVKETRLQGIPLSKGCVVGKVCMVNENRHTDVPMYRVEGIGAEAEIRRFERAREIAGERLDNIRNEVREKIGVAEAEIFVAQKMILDDPDLAREITNRIVEQATNAETAIVAAFDLYEGRMAALSNEYLSARASDIGEIRQRLLDVLGNMRPTLRCDKEHCQQGRDRIVAAEELTPSLTIEIEPEKTLAFITERGGINSHAAILARALGIPAVSGLEGITGKVGCGTEVLVNGDTGEVILWPSESAAGIKPVCRVVPIPTDPVDGFVVMANLNWASDVRDARAMQAEGAGLYRTEFEILAAERFLSEDELFERYDQVARALHEQSVVFRLFDLGSDKTLPALKLAEEDNPALGWRGTRLLLGERTLLESQVRALARASRDRRLDVMYPMIVDTDQFLAIRDIVEEVIREIPHGEIRHGIMFEVPSACLDADALFEHVDFASVGTNDLVQYLFAVDRDNDRVSYDYNPDRPVFWNLIGSLADAAQRAGKPLSVCGELAGYPQYVEKLVAAGITRVSVSPRRITDVRNAAREVLGNG